jgi:peptide chain release factor subunit 1
MEKRIVYDIEPPAPISHTYYRCSPNFHFDEIKQEIFHRSKIFGFIIVDGEGAMYATL